MRQVAFDTETTGLSYENDRLTEIGCVEIIDRVITGRTFQTYLNPEKEVGEKAVEITGLTTEFLQDKPKFAEVVDAFLQFIDGAELIIHNAVFDISFLKSELNRIKHPWKDIESRFKVLDTLLLSRKLYPGQRHSLDALCKRLNVDNSQRQLHGALLDADILAQAYLAMTAGQTSLQLNAEDDISKDMLYNKQTNKKIFCNGRDPSELNVIKANHQESVLHKEMLDVISKKSEGRCLFLKDPE